MKTTHTFPHEMLFRAIILVALLATGTANAANFKLQEATVADVHAAFKAGQLTCRQLVQLYLNRIAAYDKQGPALNAAQNVNEIGRAHV